jgi:hypothetical protein
MQILNKLPEQQEQFLTVIGSHAVIKLFRLDNRIIWGCGMWEELEEVVFEREEIRDDQGHLVEFVGFPKGVCAALKTAGVAFEKDWVFELFDAVLFLVLKACE